MKKYGYIFAVSLLALFLFVGCSKAPQAEPASTQATPDQATSVAPEASSSAINPGKLLYVASQYAHPSLDTHKGYHGWYTSIYGISETLFKVADDSTLQPLLAEAGHSDGCTWTITLKDKIHFSNGSPVTAEMVIKNLERVAVENPRFSYMDKFAYKALDDKTFTITTQAPYPTMLNTLACCETGILDLDKTTDFDNAIIATGPFVIEKFIPEGTMTVARNDNYWNGNVLLDGAVFYRMPNEETMLMAMQNKEIDSYTGVGAAAVEIFKKDPSVYNIVTVPSTRIQFYILNQNRLSANVRKAINLAIDRDKIIPYLGGTVSATQSPFSSSKSYGKSTTAPVDINAAISLIESDGYKRVSDGYFEKDGKKLTVDIAYYPARSLDILAPLMQEQLKHIGIQATLTSYEKPDSTYIATADFDIALYSMNADLSGDPEFFITSTLKDGAFYNVGGFQNAECEKMIAQLTEEMDMAKRADLANKIVQIAIDDDAFGYIALFNKATVLRSGVTGYAENSPYDFYGIDARSDKK